MLLTKWKMTSRVAHVTMSLPLCIVPGRQPHCTCCKGGSHWLFSVQGVLWLHMQVLPISKSDSIAAMLPVTEFTGDDFLVMLTKNGLIKRTPLSDFETIRSNGLQSIKLRVRSALLRSAAMQ